jgi:hypothetical protein
VSARCAAALPGTPHRGGAVGHQVDRELTGQTRPATAPPRPRRSSGVVQGRPNGASRTRTGDLLGAIGDQRPECGHSVERMRNQERRLIRNLRDSTRGDFPQVLARGGVGVAGPPTAIGAGASGAAKGGLGAISRKRQRCRPERSRCQRRSEPRMLRTTNASLEVRLRRGLPSTCRGAGAGGPILASATRMQPADSEQPVPCMPGHRPRRTGGSRLARGLYGSVGRPSRSI